MTTIPSTLTPPPYIDREIWDKVGSAIDLIEKAVKRDGTPFVIYSDSNGTYLCTLNATYRLLSGTLEVENGEQRLTISI